MKQRVIRAAPWLLLAIAVLVKAAWYFPPWLGDFRVYHTAALAVLHGEPLYGVAVPYFDPTQAHGVLVFTYPPFAALLTVPFAFLSASTAGIIFFLLNFVLLVIVCKIVAGQLPQIAGRDLPWSGWPLVVGIVALALFERPVVHLFNLGQIGLVLMLFILLDALVVKRGRGILTGLATGIKVTPGMFILLMATTGRWRQFWISLGTFAITIGLGLAVQPEQAWRFWTELIFDSDRVGDVKRTDNGSILGIVSRAVDGGSAQLIWLPIALVILVAGTWLATDWWRRDRLVSVSVMAVTGLLISPISWDHHWIWVVAIVPVFMTLAVRGWDEGKRGPAVWAAVAAISIFLVTILHPEGFAAGIYRTTGVLTPAAQVLDSMYAAAGIVILLAAWRTRSLMTPAAKPKVAEITTPAGS